MKKIILLIAGVVAIVALVYYFGSERPSDQVSNGDNGQNRTEMRTVNLYYYSPDRDTDASGNILCSQQGLVGLEREIPITQTPIQDAVRLLLEGELTQAERAIGITTEYPLQGLELEGANLQNGVLTLEFSDPLNRTSGGSCRAGILWYQIEATALQFPEVSSVRFSPEELFQP